MAFGVGIILSVVVKALLYIVLALGGAYALTTYVSLPGLVDVLIWLVAGGYTLLCVIGVYTVLAGLAQAGGQIKRRF